MDVMQTELLHLEPLQQGNIRLAASLLLVREGALGPEVFMMKRPGGVDFPDLHVFPGGKLDAGDYLPDLLDGIDDATASRALGVAAGGLRYWVAAIRECFEECGVLLAHRDGALVRWRDDREAARFDAYRQQLIDGDLDMAVLCQRESLRLAGDRVAYFSHWITPPQVPRRFDTRFFITEMPADQDTLAHHWEAAGEEWVRPVDALAAHAAGDWRMISPTLITLQSIAGFADVASMLGAVATESHLLPLTEALRDQGMHTLR
jgi:8-oxo-dGTP pyrophosphatase MutT (NUDIX family)